MSDLSELAKAISVCTLCKLYETRTRAVPGEGPENAKLMMVGEGPGFNEDQQARPFVGAAGKFLDELLASVDIKRSDVYITNVVKCRPPNNRDPLPNEVQTCCTTYLDKQVEFIKPKVIVTLGRYSMGRFLPNETISKVHGKVFKYKGITIYPLYHPAAALHQGNLRKTIEDDFKRVPDLLKQIDEPPQPPLLIKKPDEPPKPKQISMF